MKNALFPKTHHPLASLTKAAVTLLTAALTQSVNAQELFGRLADEGVDIVGSVTYGKKNSYDAMTQGYYRFSYDNRFQAQLTEPLREAIVSGGCTYHNGKIYASEYDDSSRLGFQKPHWVVLDAKTFEVLYDRQMNDNYELTTLSMTYDPTTDAIYAINRTYMETFLITIDPATGTPTRLGADLDNNYRYEAIGCDKKGDVYCIYMESKNDHVGIEQDLWYLGKVNKSNGSLTKVGDISMGNLLSGDSFINDTRKQSLFCNFKTGKLYWIYPSSSLNLNIEYTCIAEIDPTTAQGTLAAYLNNTVLTTGAFFQEPCDKAPTSISAFEYVETSKDDRTGKLQFVMPAEAYDGSALTGELSAVVTEEDGDTIACLKGEAGALVATEPVKLDNGDNKVGITVSNAVGDGPTVYRTFFVGKDSPAQCQNIRLTSDGLKTILTWDAPTTGENGQPIDVSQLTYDVVRYPYEVTVAKGITECRFEETHPAEMTRYVYLVTPHLGRYDGQGAFSNNLIVGTPLDVPYGGAFTNPADMINYYTILDANNDGYSWKYSTSQASAVYGFNPNEAADDWLISPPVNYKAGHTYVLRFSAHSAMEEYPEAMDVTFGNGRSPEEQSDLLRSLESIPLPPSATEDNVYEVEFTVPQDGVYYYGFHCITPAYHANLFLHDISVQDKAEMTAVSTIDTDNVSVKDIYNSLGMKTNRMQRGLNIVRWNDGTTHKVISNN